MNNFIKTTTETTKYIEFISDNFLSLITAKFIHQKGFYTPKLQFFIDIRDFSLGIFSFSQLVYVFFTFFIIFLHFESDDY